MEIFEFIVCMLFVLSWLAVAAFAAGPYVLQWFFETLDKWAEIIDSAKDEE